MKNKTIKTNRLKMIKENPKVLKWMQDPVKLRIINYFASEPIKK